MVRNLPGEETGAICIYAKMEAMYCSVNALTSKEKKCLYKIGRYLKYAP